MPIWRLDCWLGILCWYMLVAPYETILIPVNNWTQYLWGCFCIRSLHAMCIMLRASEKQQLTQLFWINETNVTINGLYKPSQNRSEASMPKLPKPLGRLVMAVWGASQSTLEPDQSQSVRTVSRGVTYPSMSEQVPSTQGTSKLAVESHFDSNLPIWHVKHCNFSARHEVLKQSSSTLASSL